MLHGLVGGIMAEINGGKFGDGLTAAAINEILIGVIDKNKEELGLTSDQVRWISAIVGGSISESLGGNFGEGAGVAEFIHRYLDKNSEYQKLDHGTRQWIAGALGGALTEILTGNGVVGIEAGINVEKNNFHDPTRYNSRLSRAENIIVDSAVRNAIVAYPATDQEVRLVNYRGQAIEINIGHGMRDGHSGENNGQPAFSETGLDPDEITFGIASDIARAMKYENVTKWPTLDNKGSYPLTKSITVVNRTTGVQYTLMYRVGRLSNGSIMVGTFYVTSVKK